MAFSKARRLSDFISGDGSIPAGKFASSTITSDHIVDASIVPGDMHATLNLTGKTVTVATASGTTNTTAVASTAFVQQELTTLIGGAPSTLNDLNELAAAINDDANYNSTLTTALGTKLPKAGGTMTGALIVDAGNSGLDIRLGTDKRVTWSGGIGEIGSTAGFQAINTAGSALAAFGIRASELKFATGSATRMTINSSGKVGIGTPAPVGKLHVYSGDAGTVTPSSQADDLVVEASTEGGITIMTPNDQSARIRFTSPATESGDLGGADIFYRQNINKMSMGTTVSGGKLAFKSNAGVETMVLSGGNVGIGTDNPGVKLDIIGGINGASLRVKGDQPAGAYYYGIMYDGTNLRGTTQTNIIYSGCTIAADTTVAEYAGLRIDAPSTAASGSSVTNNFGIYQSGAAQKNYFRGNTGIATSTPFSRLQSGSNTFSGGHGMYSNARVGISNHGSLTGLMLASTYNDASHPDYGLVFVQGPSTSSYNVWSISPDGPAKGTGLNFHYGAQATNIHGASHKRITFKGDGSVIIGSGGTTTYNAALQVKGNITTTVDGDAYQLYYTESRDFITHSGAAAIIKQIDNDASTAMIQFRAWNNSPLMTMMNSGNVAIGNGAASTVSRLKTIGASNTSSNYTFEACNASGNTRFLVRNDGETNFYNASNQPSFQVASTGIKSFLGQNAFPTVFYKSGGYSEQTVTRFSMTMIGNTAYVIQFAGMANGAAHVRLIGSHWTQGYGTGRESYIFTDSYTSISELNQYNHSTATSGGWTITRASTPSANSNLVITKTAGNYVGSFVAMIEITSQWPLTIASIA